MVILYLIRLSPFPIPLILVDLDHPTIDIPTCLLDSMTLVTAEIDIPPPAIYTFIVGSSGAGMVRACTDGGELQIARLRHWTRLSVFVQAPAQEVRGGCDSARVGGTCGVRLDEGGMF